MKSLSTQGRERLAKVFTTLTAVTTTLSLSGVMYLAPTALAVAPADYGLREGDVISAAGSDDPDVYIVNEPGYKRLFLNPAIFNFYGHLGGFAAVKNVSAATRDAFGTSGLFRNCETNDPKVYGVETTGEDTGMLHWVNTSGAQAVMDDPNFFSKVFCINNNEFNWYSKGADYTSVNQVPNYSRGPIVSSGPLSASLASDNPVSGTLVDNSAMADLAHFNVMGSGTVTSVEMRRLGVSADTTLSAVYLFVNGVRISDSGNVSSGMITFSNGSGLFNAPATLVVKSNILTGTAGQTVGVQLTKLNTSAVSVSGNVHSIADGTLAGVIVGAPTGPGDFDPQKDVNVWQSTLTISTEDVYLKRLTIREVGSVNNADINNLRLFIDGVQVASAAGLNTDGYATFTANYRMLQGSRVVKVIADVIGGSSRTMQIQIKGAYDLEAMDEAYGANVIATAASSFPAAPTASTLGNPTLTVVKATDSPSANVVDDAKGVRLAKFMMTGYGEAIKIETMAFTVDSSDNSVAGLDNGRVFIGGTQYGSTTDLLETDGAVNTTYTVNYTLQPGVAVPVEVYADIADSDAGGTDVNNGDTMQVKFEASDNNYGQGVSSAVSVDVPHGTTDVTGNTITISTGSLTIGKYTGYANQSIVAPRTGMKFGHFTLAAASSENVNINTLDVTGDLVTDAGDDWDEADITDMYVKVWNDAGSVVYTSGIKSTVSTSASNSYSVNFSVPANKTYQIEVWGNISSTDATAGDAFTLSLDASGTTAQSATSAEVTRVTGQTITAQSGSLTVANGSFPTARLINGGQTVTGYQFTMTPAYNDYTLEELYVDIASTSGTLLASTSNAVSSLTLKEGSNVLGSAVINSVGSASFTGLNVSLPSGVTKTFTVEVALANVAGGTGNDTAGKVQVQLDGHKVLPSGSTSSTTTGLAHTNRGNANWVVKSYPTFTNVALGTSALVTGTQTLFKTSLAATGGQISWNNIVFTVASSSTSTIGTFKLFENSVDTGATASTSASATSQGVEFNFSTPRVVAVGTPVTLELRATVGGTLTAGDSISTSLANPAGSSVTSEDATTQLEGSSFVWSDHSAAVHTTSTDDWFDDALVKNITETQSLSN